MRALLSLAFLLLLCPDFARSASAASTCVASCADIASGAAPLLNFEFGTFVGEQTYIAYCNGNPKGPDLFPNDHDPLSVASRLRAYCQYNPAFRMCFVCERLKNKNLPSRKQKSLESSLDSCSGLLNGQSKNDFLRDVVKPNQKTATEEPSEQIPAENSAG